MNHFPKYLSEIKTAILIRRFEEKLLELYSQGKLHGTIHTCVGQEFSGVMTTKYLDSHDFVLSNHRGHGHYLARTQDVRGLLAEILGKVTGPCGGIGGSQHLIHQNYISSGIQGGMTPIACGVALANKLKKKESIVVVFIGDGTLGEGVLYESFNLAGLWKLPVLYVLENNQYAQSTSIRQSLSGTISGRVQAFGLKYFQSSTDKLEHLDQTAQQAVHYVKQNNQPAVLEIETHRLNSHSKGDDNRDPQEIERYRAIDPLNIFKKECPEAYEKFSQEANRLIAEALHFVETSETLSDISCEEFFRNEPVNYEPILYEDSPRINEAIYECFKDTFSASEKYIMIGEDIETSNEFTPGEYGGAFKVTRDLSQLFKDRVRNTPISEAAIIGIGTGLAISGLRPIVEIMFGDFLTLAFDQILQHAAKFHVMYNQQVNVPLVIRTPMGGLRGYGPTHSQSIEKHFLGISGLNVVALNHRVSPYLLYSNILKIQKNPTLVIENKVLYTKRLTSEVSRGFEILVSNEEFPTVKIRPSQHDPDYTIVCYGGVLLEVEQALEILFDEEEILAEVICPSMIHPLNIFPIKESVSMTRKLITVEEGPSIAALSSEVMARLAEEGVVVEQFLRIAHNSIIPCSHEAEKNVLPIARNIVNQIKTLRHVQNY